VAVIDNLYLLFLLYCQGLFKHSQELAKAYLADVAPRSQHSHVFGRFNSVSNIGFIIGPIIGGYAVDFGGFHVVAMLTASIFLLNYGQFFGFSVYVNLIIA